MNTSEIISFITAAAATIGALATWKAAEQARESAKIAKKSMESASEMARKNLDETTRYNRRSAFENRYGLLLAQHNLYHNQLCEYIDKQTLNLSTLQNTAIGRFFEDHYTSGSMGHSLSFLTGHQIISRYMRTLYHLLKFIKNEFYIDKVDENKIKREMKNYVSPVRSTIRNDILCLIAVNALNIQNKNSEPTGYLNYQKLLHFFDFFEHAVFHSPFSPNKVFEDEDVPKRIHDLILKQSQYESWFNNEISSKDSFKLPHIQFFSPVIACLIIYKNPMQSATKNAVETIFDEIKQSLSLEIKSILAKRNKLQALINEYKNGKYITSSISEQFQTTEKLFGEIDFNLRFNTTLQYDEYMFTSSSNDSISGPELMKHMDYVNHYKAFYDEINKSGGVESFLRDTKNLYLAQLPAFYKQVNVYSSGQ